MTRKAMATLLVVLAAAAPATADPVPARLRWTVGQLLTYRVDHTTQDVETADDATLERKSSLNVVKTWQVVEVDKEGVATMRLWLRTLKWELTKPGGDVLRYDSANPDKATPQLKEQFDGLFKAPLAILRIDPLGRVVQVKESRHGPASRYEIELPFIALLPAAALEAGRTWERDYAITLEPPQGAGEKYAAVQRYACKGVTDDQATISLTTTLKEPPAAAADQMPLLDKLLEGDVVFDLKTGRMAKATLRVDKELKGQMGDKSSYHVQSSYVEQYVGDK